MRTIFTFYLVLVDIIGNVRIFTRRRKLSFRVTHFNIFILNILIIDVNIRFLFNYKLFNYNFI